MRGAEHAGARLPIDRRRAAARNRETFLLSSPLNRTKKSHALIIADDHPVFREGLRKVIEQQAEWKLIGEAGDGPGALELIRQHEPAIAVLDIVNCLESVHGNNALLRFALQNRAQL